MDIRHSDDPTSTSRIQNIAGAQIARQAEICSANLDGVRDKMTSINGDMTDISTNLAELRREVATLMLDMASKFAALRLDVTRQVDSLTAQTKAIEQASRQRWSIWPTLKDILIVVLSLVSLGLTVYALMQ